MKQIVRLASCSHSSVLVIVAIKLQSFSPFPAFLFREYRLANIRHSIPSKHRLGSRLPIHHHSCRPLWLSEHHHHTATDHDMYRDMGIRVHLLFVLTLLRCTLEYNRYPLPLLVDHHRHWPLLPLHLPFHRQGTLGRRHHPRT